MNENRMNKNRLEAFSDGVFAIIITIMVLELKAPHGDSLSVLFPLIPALLSYVISFVYVAIYWNNHHHLFQLVKHVNGLTLWANVHLLFWLSLVPFVTAWSGENHFTAVPVALYGLALLMASIAYFILAKVLLVAHGKESDLAKAMGRDFKGRISTAIYAIAIPLAFWSSHAALLLYVLVAAIWIVPDKRVERVLGRRGQ
jgi:uncharacterized membrane protein